MEIKKAVISFLMIGFIFILFQKVDKDVFTSIFVSNNKDERKYSYYEIEDIGFGSSDNYSLLSYQELYLIYHNIRDFYKESGYFKVILDEKLDYQMVRDSSELIIEDVKVNYSYHEQIEELVLEDEDKTYKIIYNNRNIIEVSFSDSECSLNILINDNDIDYTFSELDKKIILKVSDGLYIYGENINNQNDLHIAYNIDGLWFLNSHLQLFNNEIYYEFYFDNGEFAGIKLNDDEYILDSRLVSSNYKSVGIILNNMNNEKLISNYLYYDGSSDYDSNVNKVITSIKSVEEIFVNILS